MCLDFLYGNSVRNSFVFVDNLVENNSITTFARNCCRDKALRNRFLSIRTAELKKRVYFLSMHVQCIDLHSSTVLRSEFKWQGKDDDRNMWISLVLHA